MVKTPLGISMVIPGYNEEPNVEATVARCTAVLSALVTRYEIVIIDDGSTDRTGEIADRLAREHGHVRVIHNPINLGVGPSVLIGMRAAQCDLVVHNSMDCAFDPADLERILPLFPENDVAVIVRIDRSAHSPWRKLTSFVNHWMIRLLFGVGLRDMNFTQVYKREVLRSLPVKAKSPAFVTPEILIRARDRGYRITEIQAPFHARRAGTAKHGRLHDILWTLADMSSFWQERRKSPKAVARPDAAAEPGPAGEKTA